MTAEPANRIREIRSARGLTQSRLAELVNATTQQISYLERGERQLTLHWMTRLAAALGCAPADLFSPAPPQPALGIQERLWLDLFRALSPAERDALMTVGRSMAGGDRAWPDYRDNDDNGPLATSPPRRSVKGTQSRGRCPDVETDAPPAGRGKGRSPEALEGRGPLPDQRQEDERTGARVQRVPRQAKQALRPARPVQVMKEFER